MKTWFGTLMLLVATGCSLLRDEEASNTFRHGFTQPAAAAAACFARNAERHSSALVARTGPADARGQLEVVVEVRNGVRYATAEIRPAGTRAEGVITLMVVSRHGNRQLVDSLVEGC